LIQKKQKIKSVEMLLYRTTAYAANQEKPGLGTFAPLTLIASPSAKVSLCPATTQGHHYFA
jgi:hypothetical protein